MRLHPFRLFASRLIAHIDLFPFLTLLSGDDEMTKFVTVRVCKFCESYGFWQRVYARVIVQFNEWWNKHKAEIKKLSASVRVRFNALIQSSGKAAAQDWELPDQIVEKKEGTILEKHLFCDTNGEFSADLNGWEMELLTTEMEKKDFVCWLRNFDRRDWSFCIPYEMGGVKPFYPDFAIIRKSGKGFVVDILEPHDNTRIDTLPKAVTIRCHHPAASG